MQFPLSSPLWALGLMSGTSADGIDAALIQTDGTTITAYGPTHYVPYSDNVRAQILQAYDMGLLEQVITEHHIEAVFTLLEKAQFKPSNVNVIGFHGQTLFHNPPETHTIGDGPLLSKKTGIVVVDQLRLNNMAHGGQGAPLVPIFHQALTQSHPKPIAVLNIGGVANVTWIGEKPDELLAFDTGPGNGLIDDLVRSKTDLPWDEGGKIAASGHVHEALLSKWLSHPYFTRKPPKSLDRQTFTSCIRDVADLPFEDGVATLTALTGAAVDEAAKHFPTPPSLWLVAGGGAHNPTLLKMLRQRLNADIQIAADQGWNGDALEAQAWGFLAVRSLRGLPLTFPGTTGVAVPLTGGRVCYFAHSSQKDLHFA